MKDSNYSRLSHTQKRVFAPQKRMRKQRSPSRSVNKRPRVAEKAKEKPI